MLKPDVKFLKDHAEDHLEQFTKEARLARSTQYWRCLYSKVDPEITKDPARKKIAETFLESSFDSAHDIRAYWLVSGHLFIFFQGPARAIISEYETFLDSISLGETRPEYHFFWELNQFWGYFDEVIARALSEEEEASSGQEGDSSSAYSKDFKISDEQKRARQVRYKPLLLIVEDDRVTRHMLQASMEKYCDIVVAWNLAQGYKLYQHMLPNIAFLDIRLPDGDGQSLAGAFCENDPEAFVVMVSGALSKAKAQKCIDAGAKGCVVKPAREEALLKFIDQYNRRRNKGAAPISF